MFVWERERERERENISQSLKETIEHMNQTTPILHMHKLQAQGVCVCVWVSLSYSNGHSTEKTERQKVFQSFQSEDSEPYLQIQYLHLQNPISHTATLQLLLYAKTANQSNPISFIHSKHNVDVYTTIFI